MFDHPAVHVSDPDRPVRASANGRRREPRVGGGEELALLLVGGPAAREGDAGRHQYLAVDEVMYWLAGKPVVGERRTEEIIAVDHDAATGGERVAKVPSPAAGIAGHVARRIGQHCRRIDTRVWGGDVRISANVVIVERVMPHRLGVGAAEPVAAIVAVAAELRLAGLRIELAGVRTNPQITIADIINFPCLDGFHGGTAQGEPANIFFRAKGRATRRLAGQRNVLPYLREVAVRTVHPVIQSPTQAVDAVLRADFAETSEEHLLLVRLAVTIGVHGVKNVRGASDQHAFAPGHDAGWIFESVEKDGGLVVLAVAFSALQALDPAARLPLVV